MALACSLYGQQAQNGLQQGTTQSGMASGGAHAPVRDALHRPITAGGFVDGAPVVFSDITIPSGLAKFHHRSGTPEKSTTMGGWTYIC
jgi:enediyne biosynthesis protein E4